MTKKINAMTPCTAADGSAQWIALDGQPYPSKKAARFANHLFHEQKLDEEVAAIPPDRRQLIDKYYTFQHYGCYWVRAEQAYREFILEHVKSLAIDKRYWARFSTNDSMYDEHYIVAFNELSELENYMNEHMDLNIYEILDTDTDQQVHVNMLVAITLRWEP